MYFLIQDSQKHDFRIENQYMRLVTKYQAEFIAEIQLAKFIKDNNTLAIEITSLSVKDRYDIPGKIKHHILSIQELKKNTYSFTFQNFCEKFNLIPNEIESLLIKIGYDSPSHATYIEEKIEKIGKDYFRITTNKEDNGL
jgi:hypothetical protein